MPDWTQYVRDHLPIDGVAPGRAGELVDDLAQHLEDAYRDAQARGLSAAEAEAAAKRHISDWDALGAELAGTRRFRAPVARRLHDRADTLAAAGPRWRTPFAGLMQDLLFAGRMMRKSPGTTIVAVLTLALGIGANTTIFSWVSAILLQPLPGTGDPARLVEVVTRSKTEAYTSLSYPDFQEFRGRATTLDGLAVHDMQPAALSGSQGAERIWVELVSANYFDVMRVRPLLGRPFSPEEGRGPLAVVILSERLWRSRFEADARIIGRTIQINRSPFVVVGVAPAEFHGGYTGLAMDAWAPVRVATTFIPGPDRIPLQGSHWLNAVARLAPGATVELASSELTAIATDIARSQGDPTDVRMDAYALWRAPNGAQSILGPILMVLMGLVGVILLITCANLASLQLSRTSARRREFAVRLAIGCGRARLLRQMASETLLLVGLAAGVALVAQTWTAGLLVRFVPPSNLPVALDPPLDVRLLGFTAVLAIGSAFVFGLAPALQATRTSLTAAVKDDVGPMAGRRTPVANVLVVAQLAFSLLLLVAAGLFIKSLQNARLFDPGFRSDHMLLASLDLYSAGYDESRGRETLDALLARVRALPGVEAATLARRVPLSLGSGSSSTTLAVEGFEPPRGEQTWAFLNWVGPEYFKTMGIPVREGREFAFSDTPAAPEVLVVNQTFADRYCPRQHPIGRRVRFGQRWYPIAGVVADSTFRRLEDPDVPFVYLSTTWNYRPDVILHVRTITPPMTLAPAVRSVVHDVDPALPVFGVMTLEDSTTSATFQQRLAASLLTAFGLLAVLLASVGLYATMAHAVLRRTREIGIRMALGATRRDIGRLVLGRALRLIATGLAAGTLLSVAVTRLFATLLFGVEPSDPAILLGVACLLTGIALVASGVPARRATRVDPLAALRYE